MDNHIDLGLVGFVAVVTWLICGVVAGVVGPSRYFGRLFVLTFLFMGPVGIAAALITKSIEDFSPVVPEPEKRKLIDGRRRFVCPRCGAENDIPDSDPSYDCWRCNEHRAVKAKPATT